MAYLLAADIGGTKTNIGIFDSEQGCQGAIVEETLLCKNYSSFNELLKDFLDGKEHQIECACFAAAGPVREGRVQLTNLPWLLEEEELRQVLGIESVYVINDLVALAYSIPELTEKDIVTLHKGAPEKLGTMGIVAPGTGLGMAFLVWDGSKYIACPSEGGHIGFTPNSDLEIELLQYYSRKGEHVSCEFFCSGQGISYIYKFLKMKHCFEEPEWLKALFNEAEDVTPVIVDLALDENIDCSICTETLKLFVDLLAGASRNLALTVMSTGGIYLGGGISVKILKFFNRSNFSINFKKMGKMSELIEHIPLKVISTPKAPLVGAIKYAALSI